jgi:hypothetical protein
MPKVHTIGNIQLLYEHTENKIGKPIHHILEHDEFFAAYSL